MILYQNNAQIDQEALRKEITEANERINDLNVIKTYICKQHCYQQV